MTRFLEGRGAVVTGGGRGIGEAVARALAEAGAKVVVAARTEPEIEATAGAIRDDGGEAWAIPCDVTDEGAVETLAAAARERLGAVDVVVASAGIASSSPVAKQNLEGWNRILAVNATGTFLTVRAFLPGMVERGWGRVAVVASVAGLAGSKYIAAYAASKHAAVGLVRSAAFEAAEHGVTVNAICPGYVDTPMTDRSIETIVERAGLTEEEARRAILATTPQRRLIEPDEVAGMAVWLCREEARAVNGQAIAIDGGGMLP